MKILVVSSFLPFPLFSGGHVRLYNILKELSKKHEITLVCEKRKHQTEDDIAAVKKFCKDIFIVERKKQWSPQVIVKTTISLLPFLLAGHALPSMKKILKKLLQEKQFDVIHVETFYVMQNLPETHIPVVLVEHNIEHEVYERFAKHAPFLLRPLLMIDIEKIKHWEKFYWKKAHVVVGVSQYDIRLIREVNTNTMLVANGVDLQSFPYKKNGEKRSEATVLFMGDFKWIQNRNAAMWILKDIWLLIQSSIIHHKSSIDLKLWIVGKHIPGNIKQYASSSIVIDEHAPDKTSDVYKKSDILLAPLRVGGGSGYKILEAMASGVGVVTTELGVQGLDLPQEQIAMVSSTAQELADDTIRLLKDKKLYNKQRESARKFIETTYSWPEIVKNLEKAYEKARQ